jgi:hypothetical protein
MTIGGLVNFYTNGFVTDLDIHHLAQQLKSGGHDNVRGICLSGELVTVIRIKPCGHIFYNHCLEPSLESLISNITSRCRMVPAHTP